MIIVAMKGVMGYSAFIWGLFIANSARMPPFPNPQATALPPRIPWLVVGAALGGVAIPAAMLLPALSKAKAKAQQTVDQAQTRYFVVHLHRLLDPSTAQS